MEKRQEILSELARVAELSLRGATERSIETAIVKLIGLLGWDGQIEQDVRITQRDRADILLKMSSNRTILFEVKKYGAINRDSAEQVWRYVRLLRPQPSLAFLTDGVHWKAFYALPARLFKFFDINANEPEGASQILGLFVTLYNSTDSHEAFGTALDFLSGIQETVQQLPGSEQTRFESLMERTFCASLINPNQDEYDHIMRRTVRLKREPIQPRTRPSAPPSPRYSRIVEGRFGDESALSWKGLVHAGLRVAVRRGMTADQIASETGTPLEPGSVSERGYEPVDKTPFSVQGMDAARSLHVIDALARKAAAKAKVTVAFSSKASSEWRHQTYTYVLPRAEGAETA